MEVKHGWVVVHVADLDPECAESCQCRRALVLRLHRHTVVRHASLGLTIEDVRRSQNAGLRLDVEEYGGLVRGFHDGVSDVAVSACVIINSRDLRGTTERKETNELCVKIS